MGRVEPAHDQQRYGKGHQAAQDGEEHARRGQCGALVVIGGQLGGQGVVGHVDEGGHRIIQRVNQRVIDAQPSWLAKRRAPPDQGERQHQGQRAEEQERAAASPARACAVGDVADDRVVDVVPGAADEDGERGDGR